MFGRRRRPVRLGRYLKLPFRTRVLFILVFCVTLAGLLCWLIDRTLAPVIWTVAEIRADREYSRILNEAILQEIVPQVRYSDLVIIDRNEAGQISLLQLNTGKVSELKARAYSAIQERLAENGTLEFGIPFGQIMGSNLFASRGPTIPVKISPLGIARTSVRDVFESAGINQTRHVVYLEVAVDARVVVPLVQRDIRAVTSIPVADVIIVGEVPRAYLNLPFTLPSQRQE